MHNGVSPLAKTDQPRIWEGKDYFGGERTELWKACSNWAGTIILRNVLSWSPPHQSIHPVGQAYISHWDLTIPQRLWATKHLLLTFSKNFHPIIVGGDFVLQLLVFYHRSISNSRTIYPGIWSLQCFRDCCCLYKMPRCTSSAPQHTAVL